ncbi:MAG: alpha/beta hydrolase [Pirellulales bacterium]|jgi:fermentation-respiration switch protein FrsA (DUF1100 family)
MNFLQKIADRLVLQASTNPLDAGDLHRQVIETPSGSVDIWAGFPENDPSLTTNTLILKFPGAGGRAERSSPHPCEVWGDLKCASWTINHRGYGQSDGPSSLQNFSETCESVWSAALRLFPDHRIVLYGSSLGCLSALYLSSRHPACGLYLRNPPPLKEMISRRLRYNWWNFGMARLIAKQIPDYLDPITNAQRSHCPALLVQSECDGLVPPRFQNLIANSHSGKLRKIVLTGADHESPVPEHQFEEYIEAVEWLGKQVATYQPPLKNT